MPNDQENLFAILRELTTEKQNPRTATIDLASTREILTRLNDEDRLVAEAVGKEIPSIARAVDLVAESFQNGGRLIYFGAGTSGRLGVLDAAECPPTFGVPPEMVVGMIAGGRDTVFLSREGIEDDREGGVRDVAAACVTEKDVVFGITASRRTPYVLGALEAAGKRGAKTIFLCCNQGANVNADVQICIVVGPEAIAGSTRLKAATAQKMVLNMVTTAGMIKLGKIYGNLMVDLKPTSKKLVERAKGIIMMLTGVDYPQAEKVFFDSGRNVKVAVVMTRLGLDRKGAEAALAKAGGFLARALGER